MRTAWRSYTGYTEGDTNMAVVAEISIEEYKAGTLYVKIDGRRQQVIQRVVCDCREDAERALRMGACQVLYAGDACSAPSGSMVMRDFGSDLSGVDDFLAGLPVGVVGIVRVPDGFCDMRRLYLVGRRYPGRVRFCGGRLLSLPCVPVGIVGVDTLGAMGLRFGAGSYVLDGGMDAVPCVSLAGLELEVKEPKSARKVAEKSAVASGGRFGSVLAGAAVLP